MFGKTLKLGNISIPRSDLHGLTLIQLELGGASSCDVIAHFLNRICLLKS